MTSDKPHFDHYTALQRQLYTCIPINGACVYTIRYCTVHCVSEKLLACNYLYHSQFTAEKSTHVHTLINLLHNLGKSKVQIY